MTGPVHIRVNGRPAPQGSKRHVGNGRMIEQSKAVKPWRDAVRTETQKVMVTERRTTLSGPVNVTIRFYLPRPAWHFGTGRNRAVVKPSAPGRPVSKKDDLDKLCRAVLDGLTVGGAWADDGQVVQLAAGKWYVPGDAATGCVIKLEVPGEA